MEVVFGLPEAAPRPAPTVLTIGNFDGVHLGHQHLLRLVVETARGVGGESVVIVFDPHPRCVLRPGECPASLTALDEKRDLLQNIGIDRLVVMSFNRAVSQLTAADFCDQLLASFNLRHLIVGHDFALGRGREGDVAWLSGYGARHGFEVQHLGPRSDGEQPISSTRVRSALAEGDVTSAARLLGHEYFMDAFVEHGQQLGRTLGFPTANLSMAPNKCLPARGVYTMWLRLDDGWHMAATNVGYRPTFGGDRMMVEAFILGDFHRDIYRQRVRAAFQSRLRDELTFDTPEALIHQMGRDVEATKAHLDRHGEPVGIG